MYLALADGAARFMQGFTGPALLRILTTTIASPTGFHPLWGCFPGSFDSHLMACEKSYNPASGKPDTVWAVSRSLATTWEITVVFSSFSYLDVSVPLSMPSSKGVSRSLGMGCPIRTPMDQRFFAAPHGFSQLSTSFIASVCQGIHRTPFSTYSLHGLHNTGTRQTTTNS
jgi:hypothetical protein